MVFVVTEHTPMPISDIPLFILGETSMYAGGDESSHVKPQVSMACYFTLAVSAQPLPSPIILTSGTYGQKDCFANGSA